MPERTPKRPKRWRVKSPALPRQPFLGLALAAAAGIILADFFHVPASAWLPIGLVVCLCAWGACYWPWLGSTYAVVGAAFFLLHAFHIEDTPGQRLAARLGERPRVVTATGVVMSEPKIATSGFTTFLLKLKSIELEGTNLPTSAACLVRWRGSPEFG